MIRPSAPSAPLACALVALALVAAVPSGHAQPDSEWPLPVTAAQRPGTYFWCPGSAFTRSDIDWNLERLRDAGFGFVHVVPIYGARGAEAAYLPYLSAEWIEMFDYLTQRARDLGLFVAMTTGSGWCFGGPNLPVDAVDARVRYDRASNTVSLVPAMKVKRAAPGGEGPMINPFSPGAMDRYLERFAMFDRSRPVLPRAQYHDSFEYHSDWTADLPAAFKAARGYDLQEHYPTFFARAETGSREHQARLKADYRQTMAELHLAAMQRWTRWANERGMVTRNQAHGSPSNILDVYAAADIPETEMFGAPEFAVRGVQRDPDRVRLGSSDPRICLFAASAAHVAHRPGHQLVTSESGTWLREHWHTTLAHLKLELDLFFLSGVNQMLFHGTCYSPKDAPWPGWFFYASTQMNWRNSIWRDTRYLTDYIARCQSVLQAGQPANDVLVYWPIHDLWMNPDGMTMRLTVAHRQWIDEQRIGALANVLTQRGYAFDFVSDRMLETLSAENGRIHAPGGNYRAVVVPAAKYIPESTLRRLAELRERGAMVVFEGAIPADVPGLADLEGRRALLAAARARLEKSGAIVAADAITGLAQAGVPRETMAEAGLRFIRRQVGNEYWYFIANHTSSDFDGWIAPAVPLRSPMLLDPMTGKSGRLGQRRGRAGDEVRLQLASGEAIVLRTAGAAPVGGSSWPYFSAAAPLTRLEGRWSVEFITGGPELPSAYTTAALESWTGAPDQRAQAFAGTARYMLRFPSPAQPADEWLLDLGDVRESARVRLNGRDVAALIALPFRVRIGASMKRAGEENLFEVEVTNVSANRIRDLELRQTPWRMMKDANIVNVHYKTFEPDKWPVKDAGLLGPVRLVPLTKVPTP